MARVSPKPPRAGSHVGLLDAIAPRYASHVLPPRRPRPAVARSNASSGWRLAAVWIGLLVIALIVRLPFVLHVGTSEGGADEWYAAWRSWSVLFESGNPGSFLHPALFYDAGAALFSGLYLVGRQSGAFHSPVDLLVDFVLHEAKYLQALQLLAAVFGALTVPVVFELARRIGGWRAGLVAAGTLAILPLHVQYSQRARVDSLCVLLTALAALALHRLAERGRRRDFIASGAMIGLATAANYPAALLGVAYLAAATLARKRSASSELARSFALGVVAAAVAFALTNPYFVLTPRAAWDSVAFLLSFTVRQHPYMEDASRWFYPHLASDQSVLFAILAACAGAWLAIRGRSFRRILGLFPWLVVGVFLAVRTQEDRYISIAIPWLCAAIGVLLGEAATPRRNRRHDPAGRWGWTELRHTSIVAASLLLVALTTSQLWQGTSPLVFIGNAEENQRWVMQRWLLQHAPPGGTVWIESDVFPLVQATFADPGGRLQQLLQEAFRQAYPEFDARVLKGETVERVANFDPRLITEKQVDLAVTCDRSVRYVQGAGPEFAAQRAFYAALAEHGTRRFEAMGCWIAEIR
jgi:hypothetical protein